MVDPGSFKPRADMMDNYYGNAGTGLASQRSDIIGEFVHKSMGYKGKYDKNITGRQAWNKTFDKKDAWDPKGKLRFKAEKPVLNPSIEDKGSDTEMKLSDKGKHLR